MRMDRMECINFPLSQKHPKELVLPWDVCYPARKASYGDRWSYGVQVPEIVEVPLLEDVLPCRRRPVPRLGFDV